VTINVKLTRTGSISSQAQVRHHTVCIDRPASTGGTDTGPMGGELFLVALGGCFMSNLLAVANERSFELQDLLVDISGDIVDGRFEHATVEVLASAGSEEELVSVVTEAESKCLVANTVRSCVALKFTAMRR
jgi:putative redox protein